MEKMPSGTTSAKQSLQLATPQYSPSGEANMPPTARLEYRKGQKCNDLSNFSVRNNSGKVPTRVAPSKKNGLVRLVH